MLEQNQVQSGAQADAGGVLGGASLWDALGPVHTATLFASVADVTAVAGASAADESIAGGSNGGAAGGPAGGDAARDAEDRRLIPVRVRILIL